MMFVGRSATTRSPELMEQKGDGPDTGRDQIWDRKVYRDQFQGPAERLRRTVGHKLGCTRRR